MGRGDTRDKKQKKKSKKEMERELLKKQNVTPIQSWTTEVIKPKRKAEEDW